MNVYGSLDTTKSELVSTELRQTVSRPSGHKRGVVAVISTLALCGAAFLLSKSNSGEYLKTLQFFSPSSDAINSPTLSEEIIPEGSDFAIEEADARGNSFVISYTDFMEFDSVVRLLARKGAVHRNDIIKYIPKKIKITTKPYLLHGEIGSQASEGLIAFNLVYADNFTYGSSLLVIMRLDGTLEKVYDTYDLQGGNTHFCALKLRDPSTFLLGGDTNTSELGYQYMLDWKRGAFTKLANGTSANCHDIQWAYDGDNIWQPGNTSEGSLELKDATTGKEIKNINIAPFAKDINHIGLIGHDTQAILSSRLTDAIIKVDIEQEAIMWIGGGVAGHLELVNLNGEILPNGSSLFYGQHNAEYFGENEYMLFDNNYDQRNASRMLIVHVDEELKRMTEKWEYSFHDYPWGYSPEFGDNDRLPTGNLLGCFWPEQLSAKKFKDVTYEARIAEVDRASSMLAYDVKIYGNTICESERCQRTTKGWKLYSVERFYKRPLIWNVTCDTAANEIRFLTVNNFKQNNEYLGHYNLTDKSGLLLASGEFNFSAHWRAAEVVIENIKDHDSVTVSVTNIWQDSKTVTASCI